MIREKVNLMEMFMFSLKFHEANTMKWLTEWRWVEIEKIVCVHWNSCTYAVKAHCQYPTHGDIFLSRSHSYLYGRSIFFRYIFPHSRTLFAILHRYLAVYVNHTEQNTWMLTAHIQGNHLHLYDAAIPNTEGVIY